MTRQYHFIVMFDEETNTWSMDYDTEEFAFPNGTIYNQATKEWEYGYAGDGNFTGREQEVAEHLTDMLDLDNASLLKTGDN
jgi:hypothetical protein